MMEKRQSLMRWEEKAVAVWVHLLDAQIEERPGCKLAGKADNLSDKDKNELFTVKIVVTYLS